MTAVPGRDREPSAFRRQLQALADGQDRGDRRPSVAQAVPTGTRPGGNRLAPVGREETSPATEPANEGSEVRPATSSAVESETSAAVLSMVTATPPAVPTPPAVDSVPAEGSPAVVPEGVGRQGIALDAPAPRAAGTAIPPPQGTTTPPAGANGAMDGADAPPPPVTVGDPPSGGIGAGKLPPVPARTVDSGRAGSAPGVIALAASPAPSARSSQPILLAPAAPAESSAEPVLPASPFGAERRGYLSEQRFAHLLTIGKEGMTPEGGGAVPPQGGEGTGFDLAEESFTKTLLNPESNQGATIEETVADGEPIPGPFGRLIENAAASERLAKEPALLLPSGRSVTEQAIVEQVVAGVPLPRGDAPSQLRLRLQPEELGQITVELVLEKEGVKAHVQVQNQQVLEVLEKHLPRLREALQEQGVRLEEMRLSTDAHGGSGSFARDRRHPSVPPVMAGETVATGGAPAGKAPPVFRPGAGLSIRI